MILGDSSTGIVDDTKIQLSIAVALIRGLLQPGDCPVDILRQAPTKLVHDPEVELGNRIPLLCFLADSINVIGSGSLAK